MRLLKIRFMHSTKPTELQLSQINNAIVYSPYTNDLLDSDGELHTYMDLIVRAERLPAGLRYEVLDTVFSTEGPEGLPNLDTATHARVPAVNSKVNVMVPGLGLLLIDEVRVFTDYCTEELNTRLQEGWRIVAVCPQPDQRRPDYVLGRSNKVAAP